MPRVLLVEDRPNLRTLLAETLAADFDVDEVAEGLLALQRLKDEVYAVVVSDVRLPGATGHDILLAARMAPVPPEVVLMTAYAAVPDAVAALKAGAYDYLQKPFEPEGLLRAVRRAAERHALVARTRELEAAIVAPLGEIVGQHPEMRALRALIERVGPLPVPVLIGGESGTGKELVARELHRVLLLGGRAQGAFVAVNCGAIPETLLEAELFGVAKGAFTGAMHDRVGLVEAAAGGTLFLDEIGEMPLLLQAKLNRLLEEAEFRRVGETRTRTHTARILAASHRDLGADVKEGRFRADLYYRLKVVALTVPPLRDRGSDIPMLAARFLHVASARYGTPARRVSAEALAMLEGSQWPGNVRELRHAIEHAAVLAEDIVIEPRHLPPELDTGPVAEASNSETYGAVVERAATAAGRAYLLRLLERTSGNVTQAAQEAGVERASLHRLLRRYGIDPAGFRTE